MKKLIELSGGEDAIILYWERQKTDDNRKPAWKDEKEGIGELENKVSNVTVYVRISDDHYKPATISRSDIVKMFNAIQEIEAEPIEPQFID